MAIVEVVKYVGSPDIFAWKYPNSELGTWTQLIVNESQEAVLYKDGQALDLFGPGKYTLETANIPILNKFVKIPFGGKSPFSAEVWYINRANSLNVKWGTPTPIQLQDPKYNVFVPIRTFGQFGIRIIDSKGFLQKIVGTLHSFTSNDIIKYFRGVYLTKVKDDISKYLIQKKVSVLEINAYINEISESLKESIAPIFADFGIELVNFYVNDISVPEDDGAVIKLKEALAKKAEMDIVGYSYSQERSFDTLEGAVNNPGSETSSMMGAGMGLGMGVGLGQNLGGAFREIGKSLDAGQKEECSHCNKEMDLKYRFCPHCGKDSSVTEEEKIVCSKCGVYNNIGLKFCGNCGNSLIITCPKCGKLINEKQNFCSNCGNPLAKVCRSCGYELNEELKFCPNCGKGVEADSND